MEQPRACSALSGDTVVALDGIWGETRARNLEESRSEEQRRMKRERERQYTQRVHELRTAQQIQLMVDADNSLKDPDSSGGSPGDPSTNEAGAFLQADVLTVLPKPSAENLVQLNPSSSLDFRRPLTTLAKCPLTIINYNSQPVAFKVKTTAPKLYGVHPDSGRVEPGESIRMSVMHQLKEEPPLTMKCKHKFLIQTTIITPDKETLSIADIWASPDTKEEGKVFEQKLLVTYLPAEGQVPEEDASHAGMMSVLSDQLYETVRQPRAANGHPGIDSQLLAGFPVESDEPTPDHEHQESEDSYVTVVSPPQMPTIVERPPPAAGAEPDLPPSTPALAPTAASAEQVTEQADNTTTLSEALYMEPPVPEHITISWAMTEMEGNDAPTRDHEHQESQHFYVTAVLPPQIPTIVESPSPASEADVRPSTPTLAPTPAAEQVVEQADNTTTPPEALHIEKPPVLEPIIVSCENSIYEELFAKFNQMMTEIEGMQTLIATLQQQQAQEAPPQQGFRRRTRHVSDADSDAPTEAIRIPEDVAPIQQEGVPLNVQVVVVIVLLVFITTYFFFQFISGKMNC